MKLKKNYVALFLAAALFLGLFTGCGGEQKTAKEDGFFVYYLNYTQSALVKRSFVLPSENVMENIEALLSMLHTPLEDANIVCAIPEEVKPPVSKFQGNGRLALYFKKSYASVGAAREALLRAAVVKNLVQLPEVESVAFYVRHVPLADRSGTPFEGMTADSFVDDFGAEQDDLATTTLTLYYASTDETSLIRERRTVHYNGNLPLEQVVVRLLSKKPQSANALSSLPSDVQVMSVSTKNGVCFVSLSEAILSEKISIPQKLTVYSIVNSLCELDNINKVQILIGTGANGTLPIGGDISDTYEPDLSLVKE